MSDLGTEPSMQVVDEPAASRYVIRLDGRPAGAARYRLRGEVMSVDHTEVDDRFEGRGVGSALARGVLDDARRRGLAVRPHCPFLRAYIARHREYVDLVRPADRPAFGL